MFRGKLIGALSDFFTSLIDKFSVNLYKNQNKVCKKCFATILSHANFHNHEITAYALEFFVRTYLACISMLY